MKYFANVVLIMSCLIACTASQNQFYHFSYSDNGLAFFKESWVELERKWREDISDRTEKERLENALLYSFYHSRKRLSENKNAMHGQNFKDPHFELWRWVKQESLFSEELFLNFKQAFKTIFLAGTEQNLTDEYLLGCYRSLFPKYSTSTKLVEILRTKNLYFEPAEIQRLYLAESKTPYLKEVLIKNKTVFRYPDLSDVQEFKSKFRLEIKKQLENLSQSQEGLLPLFLKELMLSEIADYEKNISRFDSNEIKIKKILTLVRNLTFISPFNTDNSQMIHFIFLYEVTKRLGTYPPVNMDAYDYFLSDENFIKKTQRALQDSFVNYAYYFYLENKPGQTLVEKPQLSSFLTIREGEHFRLDLYDYVQFARMASQQNYHEVARLNEYENYLKRWAPIYKFSEQNSKAHDFVKFIPDEGRKVFFTPTLTDEKKWLLKNEHFLSNDISYEGLATQRSFSDAELQQLFYQSHPLLLANISLKKDPIAGVMHAMDLYNESRRNQNYFEKIINESMNKNIHGIFFTANSDYKDAEVHAHGYGNPLEFLNSVKGRFIITFKNPRYGIVNLNTLNKNLVMIKHQENIFIAGGIDPDSIQSIEFWDVVPLEYSSEILAITKAKVIRYRKITRDENAPYRFHFLDEQGVTEQTRNYEIVKGVDGLFQVN